MRCSRGVARPTAVRRCRPSSRWPATTSATAGPPGLTGTGAGGLPPDAEDRIRNLTGLAERARAVGDGENLRTSLQALVMLRERMAAGRPGEMAARLKKLLTDRSKLAQLSLQARQRARTRFSLRDRAQDFARVLEILRLAGTAENE